MDETRPEPLGMEEQCDKNFQSAVRGAISSRVAAMLDLSHSSTCVAMDTTGHYGYPREAASDTRSDALRRLGVRQDCEGSDDPDNIHGHSDHTRKSADVKKMNKDRRRSLAKQLKRVGKMMHLGGDRNTMETLAVF